jgi:glycosyltransferase involved in cell wall biosynthesis
MRVLSLAPTSFFNDYGCHVRILEEAKALQRIGHDVTVLTYFKGNNVPGMRIIRTSPTPWHANYEVGSSRHKYAFDALLAMSLLRTLSRNRYDVIHAHLHEGALIGGVMARLWGIPVCMDYQGSLTDEMRHHGFMRPNGKREWFWYKIEYLAENSVQAIFTSTINAAQMLIAKHPHKPITALTDGVNTHEVHPDVIAPEQRVVLRARYNITATEPVIVYLGLLAKHQGIQNMIDAAALLKASGVRARWLVMGYPGIEQWRLNAQMAGVDDVLHFAGRVPYEQMPQMLALGDIAVAPKLSLTEGSGKILNYMAMALPTVAFDTPSQREILGDLGEFVPLGDTAAFANRIAQLLSTSSTILKNLGTQLRHRAHVHFSWEQRAKQMQAMYECVTKCA